MKKVILRNYKFDSRPGEKRGDYLAGVLPDNWLPYQNPLAEISAFSEITGRKRPGKIRYNGRETLKKK